VSEYEIVRYAAIDSKDNGQSASAESICGDEEDLFETLDEDGCASAFASVYGRILRTEVAVHAHRNMCGQEPSLVTTDCHIAMGRGIR
jgi:hypothetical protein